MIDLVKTTFGVLEQEYGVSNDFQKDYKKIDQIIKSESKQYWSMPNSYHVTQLFIGGNVNKKLSPIFKNYKEGVSVPVTVQAVMYVPGRILTGVAFPKAEIENQFPHLTMALGDKWKAAVSNNVLMATCNGAFKDSYANTGTQFVQEATDIGVNVGKGKSETVNVYFISFEKKDQVTFEGLTHKYY
jgi:hypothetical protein